MSIFSLFPFRRQAIFGQPRSRRSQARACPCRLLHLEPLEDRLVLSGNVISGYVFNDLNNNGLFDPGEKGIANVPLELLNASGTVVATAVTDANGYYAFNVDNTISTAPLTLTRTASVSSTPTDWTKALQVGPFDPSLGTLTAVDVINAGSITSEIKVENVDAAAATITATVSGSLTLSGSGFNSLVTNGSSSKTFNAGPFDGTVDFDDPSGHDFGPQTASGTMSFTITDPNALSYFIGTGSVNLTEVAHATSAATGAGNLIAQISTTASAQVSLVYHYIPSNSLKPGTYTIVQTSQPSGYLNGQLSSSGTVLPNSVGKHSITVTLGSSDLPNNDFAELIPASLSGYVYLDANNNGVKDPSDAGIANVTLTLTGTSDIGSVDLTTTTAGDGSYQFSNLRPGSYTMTETEPAGYIHGTDTLGSLGGSIVSALAMSVNLGVGANGTNYDFAELIPANPTGMILADSFSTPANFASPLDLSILSKLQYLSFNSTLDPNVVAEAAFVDGLYRHVLNRPADPDSLIAWVQQLQSGVSRAAVVDAVWNSPEHRGMEVDRLYQTFLNRSPDAAGRASWVQAMLAGATEMDVARALIDSAEFQADHPDNTSYVVALYHTILQRNPSGAELSNWVAALQSGLSRDAVALAFLDSAEAYQLMLNCDYTNILHRSPDPAGEQAWLSQLLSGSVSPAGVSEIFLASDEFYALARAAAGV